MGELSFASRSYAECVPIYGGGQTCTNPHLSIIKSVFNPVSNNYVHDLGINDTRFHPGERVSFHITVTNTGSGKATKVVVVDSLPSTLLAVAPNPDSMTGPAGATVTMQANDLGPDQSVSFTVVGQVADTIPPGVGCSSNKAQVTSQEDSVAAVDFSQFCVEQAVPTPTTAPEQPTSAPTTSVQTQTAPTVYPPTPTTTLPPTGPEALPIIALFPTGLTGILLRKWAKKMKKTS